MSHDAQASDQFQMSPMQAGIEEAALKLVGRPRHCLRNAYRCLKKSLRLKEIDPEMAAFCAITAEEESATAVIFALKIRQYSDAKKLNPKDHAHKIGLLPFTRAIEELLVELKFPTMQLALNKEKPRIDVSVRTKDLGMSKDLWARPDEPLNFNIRDENGLEIDFQKQFQKIAKGESRQAIINFINQEANNRNQVLYASDEGIPSVKFEERFFQAKLEKVNRLAAITIIILQTREKQNFITQAIKAYLQALGHVRFEET